MAQGMFKFSGDFSVLGGKPLDARGIVDKKSDLYLLSSWPSDNGDPYIYKGMIVSVAEEDALYMLIDKTKWQQEDGWKQVGSGSYNLGEFESFDDASDAAKAVDVCVNGEITRMSFMISTMKDSMGFIDQFITGGPHTEDEVEYYYSVQILYWQGQVKRRQIKYTLVENSPEVIEASSWHMYMDADDDSTPILYSKDSEVVDLASNQTITGPKTFNGATNFKGDFNVGGRKFTFPTKAGAVALNDPATQTANGLMSSSDKTKLDNLIYAGNLGFGGFETLPAGAVQDTARITIEDESEIKFVTTSQGYTYFAIPGDPVQAYEYAACIYGSDTARYTVDFNTATPNSSSLAGGDFKIILTGEAQTNTYPCNLVSGAGVGFALFVGQLGSGGTIYVNRDLCLSLLPEPYKTIASTAASFSSPIYFKPSGTTSSSGWTKYKTYTSGFESVSSQEIANVEAGEAGSYKTYFTVSTTNATEKNYNSRTSTFIDRTDNSLYSYSADKKSLVQVSGAQEELVIGSGLSMGDTGLSINTGSGLGIDGNNNLYITADLDVAATYDTTLGTDLTTVSAVGGIPAGTTVDTLKGRTLISIFDDILFPTDNNVTVSNAVSVDNFAINPSAKTYCYMGNDYLGSLSGAVSMISNGGTFDRGSWNKYNSGKYVVGAETSRKYELFYSDDSNAAGTTLVGTNVNTTYSAFNSYLGTSNVDNGTDNLETYLVSDGVETVKYLKPGRYTYKVTVNYNAGTAPLNNKGNTITGNTTINNAIKAGSVTSTKDVYVTKPWYATTVNTTTLTEQTKVNWRENSNVTTEQITVVSQNGTNIPEDSRQRIKIPRVLKKLEAYNSVTKAFEDTTSFWKKVSGPDDYGFYIYCFTSDGSQGAQIIKVTY